MDRKVLSFLFFWMIKLSFSLASHRGTPTIGKGSIHLLHLCCYMLFITEKVSKTNWELIKSEVYRLKEKFLSEYHTRSVDENYNELSSRLNTIIDEHVPSKLSRGKHSTPWFSPSLRRLCRKKQRLFTRAKRSHKKAHWDKYKSHKKDTLKAIRRARWEYVNEILNVSLLEKNSKPFWRYIRSQRQENIGVSALKENGVLYSDSHKKAEILNKQFSSVFTRDSTRNQAKLYGPSYPSINPLTIDVKGVEKLLAGLNISKASGPDQICCRVLKELAHEIAPMLTCIFRQSIKSATLPAIWTKAFVSPVFKKGDRCMPGNYRPVSLTCVSCKILEHIICKHFRTHLERYEILTPLNHGFRAKFSCETQLLLTLQDLLQTRDKKIQTDVAILDFSKAFDTVPHDRLLGKLEFLGIHGPLLDWTAAFLKTREQTVVVDGSKSRPTKVISGVPQGTVLGPLLFLMHINDLPSVVTSQVRLFADDCLMYRPIRSIADQVALQQDLAALERWGDTWGMRFNAGKCHIMHISRSRVPMSFMYELCGQVLFSAEEAQYLGVTLTSELSWSPHINSIANRANVSLGFLKRNLKHCPSQLKETAYIALVRSILEYACPIWDPHLRKDVDLLERVQRRAARFVNSDGYRSTSSVTSMLQSLGWKNLEDRRRDVRLALLFKIVHGQVAVSVDDIHLTKADSRTRAKHPHKYRHKPANTTELQNFFTHRTIAEWNSLKADTVTACSLDSFKARLCKASAD